MPQGAQRFQGISLAKEGKLESRDLIGEMRPYATDYTEKGNAPQHRTCQKCDGYNC